MGNFYAYNIYGKWERYRHSLLWPGLKLFPFLESLHNFVFIMRAPSKLSMKTLQKTALKSSFWPTSLHPIWVTNGNEIGIAYFVRLWSSKMLFPTLESWEHFVLRTWALPPLSLMKLQKTTVKFSFLANLHAYHMSGKWKRNCRT